jgi:hypothetical protein
MPKRVTTWLLVALVAAGGASAMVGQAQKPRAKSPAARSASLTLLTTSQRNALRASVLRVRLRSRRAQVLKVAATARHVKRGAKAVRISGFRRLRFRRPGVRTVRLRLTARGGRIMRDCRRVRLSAFARNRPGTRSSGAGVRARSSSRSVRRDSSRCGGSAAGGGSGSGAGGSGAGGGSATGPGSTRPAPLGPINTANADRCDFLDPSVCLYPFPNDHFTAATGTGTRRRLNLSPLSMPRNRAGKSMFDRDYNSADGFSPGNMIITKVPGLESQPAFERTGAVPITDVARSFDPDQPVVVINARTKQRHLIWAEVDANPANRADRTLIIRPGRNFDEGERYIVALRNLKGEDGRVLKPREEFRAYRDGLRTFNFALERRRGHFESMFKTLGEAGIARRDLYLAWDFTVASQRSLSGRMLHIRDDAFGGQPVPGPPTAVGGLGDPNLADATPDAGSVAPVVDPTSVKVTDFTPEQDSRIARRVEGRIFVPCYLDGPGCPPGSRFALNPATGMPTRNPVPHQAAFTCHIPRVALEGPTVGQTRVSLYGHGLLGSRGEINQGQLKDFGQEHNIVFCATDWAGMSCADVEFPNPDNPQGTIEEIARDIADDMAAGRTPTVPNAPNCDLPNVLAILQDLSQFPSLTDRLQQGFLNFLYLGRLMVHPQGLGSMPAFQNKDGRGILETPRRLFYDGNSQGGIFGGSLAAIGVDHQRAVLGVPGMNYSTLLRRSVDFDAYAKGDFEGIESPFGLYDNYPNELERPLILSLIQLLWDRSDPNGYAQHMTHNPLPNTPPHQVLLHVGFGDHQVADVTTEVEARTIGAGVHRPVLESSRPRYFERPPEEKAKSFFGIPSVQYPWTGSGLVFWDIGPLRTEGTSSRGTPPPPAANVPPRLGNDPHEDVRRTPQARRQKSEFFNGSLIHPCGLIPPPSVIPPCYAGGYAGSP